MSPGHCSRSVRAVFGETPYRSLMTPRIERAKALLRRGDLQVTEVCMAVGWTSLGSVSSWFTELVGESPSADRARRHDQGAAIPACVAKLHTDRSGMEKPTLPSGPACRRPTTSRLDNQPPLDGSREPGRPVDRGWPLPEVLVVSHQRAKQGQRVSGGRDIAVIKNSVDQLGVAIYRD
jgi:AraC-like DNA-binding protein